MCSYGRVYSVEAIDLSPCFLVSWSVCVQVLPNSRGSLLVPVKSETWLLLASFIYLQRRQRIHIQSYWHHGGWPHCTECWSLFTEPPLMLSHWGKKGQESPGFPYALHLYCQGVLSLSRGDGSLNSLIDILRHHPCRGVKSPLYGLVREEEYVPHLPLLPWVWMGSWLFFSGYCLSRVVIV